MRRSHLQSHHPRRGQALLLAVLIMIFAALLSASFIAIVSVNLNQTARQTDKNRAVVSATAGMDYVKRQLAFSDRGEKWRPEIPVPGSNGYQFYYSALDRAQGWADQYAKFPDPRIATGLNAGPLFLVKVDRIDANLPVSDPDRTRTELYGANRISVIGLSPEDPSAYSRSVAYFGGYRNAPIAQTMRTVSNWDFLANRAVVAQAPATGSANNGTNNTTPLLDVRNSQGNFSKLGTPFAITLSDPRNGIPARSSVVVGATPITGVTNAYTLTLARPLAAAPAPTERVELAANLGAPQGVDYANNLSLTPFNPMGVDNRVRLSDSGSLPRFQANEVDGARTNAGLLWSGDLLTTKLREPRRMRDAAELAFANTGLPLPEQHQILAPGTIQTSGSIALEVPTQIGTNVVIPTAINIGQRGIANGTLKSSDTDANNGIFASGSNYDLVSDGWTRNAGRPSINNPNSRIVPDFQPPDMGSGEGLERYMNLSRFSPPANSGNPASASLYGDGRGIYIDNIEDKEKIYEAAPTPRLREMTQSELVRMWQSPSLVSAPSFERTAAPADLTINTASLEEQHARGWVGIDEFRARGVEIELVNATTINITRDARDDNRGTVINAYGPVTAKAWKDSNGNAQPGVYRRTLPWPENGIIFAEGNIRIKGQAQNAPRSLTVVSMNNIYIEGSLSADDGVDGVEIGQPRKILLMARKNVVMNPTRVLARPEIQSVVNTGVTVAANTPTTFLVDNVSDFQVGDVVETSAVTAPVTVDCVAQITGIITTPPSLNVQVLSATNPAITANSIVRIHRETALTPPAPTNFRVITRPGDAIQRRFNLPAASTTTRVAFNHFADRITALTVGTSSLPANTKPATGIVLTNKRVIAGSGNFNPAATNVNQTYKTIRGDYSIPSPGPNNFPVTLPTLKAAAEAYVLSAAETEMEGPGGQHVDVIPPEQGWVYDVTVAPNYPTLPFFYLAGVGNRYDFGAAAPGTATAAASSPTGWQAAINRSDIAANTYEIPVATSIGLFFNGVTPSTVTNENYDATAMTYDQTRAFGFDPDYVDAATPDREDALTADQGFYQAYANVNDATRSTLDSRAFLGTLPAGLNRLAMRRNDLVATLGTAAPPDYRLLSVKLEDVALTATASTTATITPGHTFNINAFVYAQTGSWFVIPGPLFDNRLHGDATQTFFDTTTPVVTPAVADPGEYFDYDGSNSYTPGDYADLNRNGALEDSERYAMTRFSRYNYQINFKGAIAENQTTIVNTVRDAATGLVLNDAAGNPVAIGAVESWMNNWATSAFVSAPTPTLTNNRIRYIFDPTVVLDQFEKDNAATPGVVDPDEGFRLPQTFETFNLS